MLHHGTGTRNDTGRYGSRFCKIEYNHQHGKVPGRSNVGAAPSL